MPIVGFTHSPVDAAALGTNVKGQLRDSGPRYYDPATPDVPYRECPEMLGPHALWTYETHIGLCISDHENNGYHDSDFWMLVWNLEKGEPERITYATTRGWSYPSYASCVDATPETLAAYAAWEAAQEAQRRTDARQARARYLRALRAEALAVGAEHGFDGRRLLLPVKREMGWSAVRALLDLFGPRIRSTFKLSLREQVIRWAREPGAYKTPLSRKQMGYIWESKYEGSLPKARR